MCRLLAATLCALAPALPACGRTADQCTEAPSAEDSALLQLARGAAAVAGAPGANASGEALGQQPGWCPGHIVAAESQIRGLASHVGWWSTPQPGLEVLERQKAKLTTLKAPDRFFAWARPLYSFSSGSGGDAARAMFEATRGPNYSKVPDKLQGVFWMKGNGAVEELIVFHNGVWLDAESYVHNLGNAAESEKLGNLARFLSPSFSGQDVASRFTLQAMSADGSHWKRTCDWGLGQCTFLDFGSYDLVKILDGNGSPVQPHWEDWLQYIGDVQLLVWSGWKSRRAMEESKRKYESLVR